MFWMFIFIFWAIITFLKNIKYQVVSLNPWLVQYFSNSAVEPPGGDTVSCQEGLPMEYSASSH